MIRVCYYDKYSQYVVHAGQIRPETTDCRYVDNTDFLGKSMIVSHHMASRNKNQCLCGKGTALNAWAYFNNIGALARLLGRVAVHVAHYVMQNIQGSQQ